MPTPQILQMLGANQTAALTAQLKPVKDMIRMVQSASNPGATLQQMLANNPQMQQAVEFINKCGGDPQKAFYALAKQKGVNPDDILNALK